MDWNGLHADENRWLNVNYTQGREGRTIDKILIHHNAGVLSVADCYNVWQTRPASAHYQVTTDGRIGQLVHDADTAWHAGDWETNLRSIGVEHSNSGGAAQGWPISDATVEAGAHLVAALCRYYGLGRPTWGVNVFPHQHFQQTACPGQLAGALRDRYMQRAGEWYDAMAAGIDAPAATTPTPTPAPAASGKLDEDGWWGPATTRALQARFGTPVDGVVSSQEQYWRPSLAACTSGWEWTSSPQGSQLIAAMQKALGIAADGIAGPGFINALEAHYGFTPDARLDGPSNTVRAMQQALNEGRF
ncbi:peptidoglycan recognition protein family protein [Actinomyces culturomici]|uniref:peptidoglycan recognition protein family protein n=1 Tax=Actinomyces culturomici TaxID=1926276 RepID=UPI000E205B9C|nr:peptidoglycan recognition family protein [Actinomyces culturomici]